MSQTIMSIQHYGFIRYRLSPLRLGKKFQFTAKYFDTSGTPADNLNLIWTVSPPSALSINDSGFATATLEGVATLFRIVLLLR